jgi:hypothetical protein
VAIEGSNANTISSFVIMKIHSDHPNQWIPTAESRVHHPSRQDSGEGCPP